MLFKGIKNEMNIYNVSRYVLRWQQANNEVKFEINSQDCEKNIKQEL